MRLHRPEPVLTAPTSTIDDGTPVPSVVQRLIDGEVLAVADRYATGAEVLERLRRALPPAPERAPYGERAAAERAFREAALRLLAPVDGHELALIGARPIGFLAELYPELGRFWLPFLRVQELYDAWQRYRQGTHLAVIGGRVHPYFATYVPRRTEHLELFATWLAGWSGGRRQAIDVGTGTGVLARMLSRAGVEQVVATDAHPNAVESLRRDIERFELAGIRPVQADLLGEEPGEPDLVVCNPPWLPGPVDEPFDAALHYEPGWFERFFAAAHPVLGPDARLVILFSTIGQLTRPDLPHPIEAEVARGRFVAVQRLQRRVKGRKGPGGKRQRTRERVEVWELAAQP